LDVEENLLEAPLVCANYKRIFTIFSIISEVLKIVEQLDALEFSFVLLDVNYFLDCVFDVEIECVLPENAKSQLREIENVVNQEIQNL
jgi:hypothetical protein